MWRPVRAIRGKNVKYNDRMEKVIFPGKEEREASQRAKLILRRRAKSCLDSFEVQITVNGVTLN